MSTKAKNISAQLPDLDDVSRRWVNYIQGGKLYRHLRRRATQKIRFTFEFCQFLDLVDALAAQSHSHVAKYIRDQKISSPSSNRSFPAHHG